MKLFSFTSSDKKPHSWTSQRTLQNAANTRILTVRMFSHSYSVKNSDPKKKKSERDMLLANLFVTPDQIKDHIKIKNTLK